MKRVLLLMPIFTLILALSFHCSKSSESDQPVATPSVVTLTLEMVSVPANTTGFSMGYAGVADPVHTVASITAFQMAKYEVKYADWLTVKTWASGQGYTFANEGVMGDGTGDTDQHPITTVNWRDAIVWCNAASQKDGLTPVYYTDAGYSTILIASTSNASVNTTQGSEDNPYINWSANGYRLPTEAEWEYTARYIEGTTFMRGDAPSGWVDNTPANSAVDAAEFQAVGWYSANSDSSTHVVGTLAPNALGIYDMSGNVYEWTHDWNATYTTSTPYTDADSKGSASGSVRVGRGGCWGDNFPGLLGSYRGDGDLPWDALGVIGFRPVRRP